MPGIFGVFEGGRNYRHDFSCYVRTPDGKVVREEISGITSFKDIATERLEIGQIKNALRDAIREKYTVE